MRSPALLGALAGLVVALAVGAALLAAALSAPVRVPVSPTGEPGSPPSAPAATPDPTGQGASGTVTPAPSSPPVGLRVGDRAPQLRVSQLGGGEVDTAALLGRPVWINFMATWCPPCREELPVMQRLQRQLGDRIRIVVIDVREDPDTVAAFAGSLDLELPIGLDADGAEQREWGAAVLPVHYWLDANGTVREFVYGGAGPDQFIDAVRTVVPDASLAP